MSGSVLIAGIGNIFQGDDAFGVAVAQQLAALKLPGKVKVMDAGIRSLDLAFALLNEYDLTILVDATTRGGAPGTLYTIEIQPDNIADGCDQSFIVNSHGLDPVRVLALAKSMGARLKRVLLVGCEPLVVDHDDSGHIGLSEPVEAAVKPAIQIVKQLLEDFARKEEVFTHEYV